MTKERVNQQQEIDKVQVIIEKSKKTAIETIVLENELGRKYCLSKYDPKREADKLILSELEKNPDAINQETIWIVLGLEVGNVVESILDKVGKQTRVIVIEPNTMLMDRYALSNAKSNVQVLGGVEFDIIKEQLHNSMDLNNLNNITIISVPLYQEFYTRYFIKIMQLINQVISAKKINWSTIKQFSEKNLDNVIQNGKSIIEGYDLRQHEGAFKNIPALIVGSGPSLEKNIKHAKEFKGLVFTGGRSLGALIQYGRMPDFLVSIDPGDVARAILPGNLDEIEIPLVTVVQGNAKVVKEHNGPKYWVEQRNEVKSGLYLDEPVIQFDLGGTVTSLCMAVAHYMGCNPIICIGQDLAYTNNRTHSGDCQGYPMNMNFLGRYIEIEGHCGEKVLTDRAFLIFKEWFEEFVRKHPETTFINATEGGALISGMEHEAFEKVLKKCGQSEITIVHKRLKDTSRFEEDKVKIIIENLIELKGYAQKGILLSNKLKKMFLKMNTYSEEQIGHITKLNKKIEKEVDKKIFAKKAEQSLVEALFAIATEEVEHTSKYKGKLNETKKEEGIRISAKSEEIYIKFEETLTLVINTLRKMEG